MLFLFIPVVLLGFLLYKLRQRDEIDLPGPRPWPVFGNIFQINLDRPHETLDKWHKDYKGVYKMYRLGTPVIVVGSNEAMREVLIERGKDFAGRPAFHRVKMWCQFNSWQDGIGFAPPDSTWKLFRMTTQKHVKQFDSGLKRLEEVSYETCRDLMGCFASHNGVPFDPREYVINNIMNNIAMFLLGRKYTRDDPIFKLLYEVEREAVELWSMTGPHAVIDLFPWLKYFGNRTHKRFEQLLDKREHLYKLLKKEVGENDAKGGEKTLLGAFLDLLSEGKVEGGELRVSCATMDILFAATSTSAGTYYAFLIIVTHYREVFAELQREVDTVLGSRPPTLKDRDAMPYMRATIFELLRYTTILPVSLPHMATEDTWLAGTRLPKGTEVIINLWSAFHDENTWPDPFEFKPERFLDDKGQVLPLDHVTRKRLMPFGAGPRVCLGEMFAMGRLFLLMTTLIQTFEIEQPEPKVSCDPRTYQLGLVLAARDFKAKMISRKSFQN